MRVKISELEDFQGTTPQAARQLYHLIAPVLARGEPVVLDFEGVRSCSTSFFTSSVGLLIEEDKENRLPELLSYENLPEMGRVALGLATDHAIRRRENPRWAAAHDEAVRKWSEIG